MATAFGTNNLAISAKNVEKIYGFGFSQSRALRGVSVDVPRGSICLVMGPSGSGKTTLLSIVGGILTPTAGSISVLGRDLSKLRRAELARFRLHNLGFVFQDYNLFPALTAFDNVWIALTLKGERDADSRRRASELLTQVGLGDKINRLPRDLSGGEKQRVAIARALAGDPLLVLADEPTASLDSENGHAICEILTNLAKENRRTVLVATHDPRIADVADQIVALEDGQIVTGAETTGSAPEQS